MTGGKEMTKTGDDLFQKLVEASQPNQPLYKPEDFGPNVLSTTTFAAGDWLYKVTVEKVS